MAYVKYEDVGLDVDGKDLSELVDTVELHCTGEHCAFRAIWKSGQGPEFDPGRPVKVGVCPRPIPIVEPLEGYGEAYFVRYVASCKVAQSEPGFSVFLGGTVHRNVVGGRWAG